MISVEATINATTDHVWTALADPTARARWWPDMTFEATPGATLQERWTEDSVDLVADGLIQAVVSNELLRFTWSEAAREAATEVSITLHAAASGTRVRVSEEGFARLSQGSEVAHEHETGWPWHLDQLRGHVEPQ